MSFQYRLEANGGATGYSDRLLDEGVTRFAPGETKRRVFDLHATGAVGATNLGGLRAGTYRVSAAYGGVWATSTPTVTVP